ncbi:MAG: hypothetical protein IPP03_14740 [Dechloromonas sp.]|nr:hypothetical protein [Candidatus Dechloromonas phosphoritropha]MBP8788928.1 hypothetical protein [Azonexus sp.]
MSGFGSGRRGGKDTTDDMRPLDIRKLQRDGLLTPGRTFSWQWTVNGKEVASIQARTDTDRVILSYQNRSNGGEWQAMEYPVYLEWTDCTLGGRRAWFLCPGQGCGRRVAILYSGRVFACRHCHKLNYQCQRETDGDRAMRRADTIRRRLGWKVGIANLEGGKPKGMHWRTFWRLKAEYNAFAMASWAGVAQRLGMVNRRLDALGLDLGNMNRNG